MQERVLPDQQIIDAVTAIYAKYLKKYSNAQLSNPVKFIKQVNVEMEPYGVSLKANMPTPWFSFCPGGVHCPRSGLIGIRALYDGELVSLERFKKILGHELVHRAQYMQRRAKGASPKTDYSEVGIQGYKKDKDEIGAYAWEEAAARVKAAKENGWSVDEVMRKPGWFSDNYLADLKEFDQKLANRFWKTVYQYVQKMMESEK
jgi:hypothetical protein